MVLSFLAHAYIWCCPSEAPVTTLPARLAVPWCAISEKLKRPPILVYRSYNMENWRRIDDSRPVELGNICRQLNFFGGMDEEWFSMVHVAIEARGGAALAAAEAALEGARLREASRVADELETMDGALRDCLAILRRMEERCDPYVYNTRVRIPMSGWTHEAFANVGGLTYQGVQSDRPTYPLTPDGSRSDRVEQYFGETGTRPFCASFIRPSLRVLLPLPLPLMSVCACACPQVRSPLSSQPWMLPWASNAGQGSRATTRRQLSCPTC